MPAKHTISLTLLVAVATALPVLAASQKAEIPAKAISARTSVVGYFNIEAITPDALAATAHTFTAGVPDSAKLLRQRMNAKIDAAIAKFKNARASLNKAGAHILLLGVSSGGPSGKTQDFSLVQGDHATTVDGLTTALKDAASDKTKQPPKVTRFTGNWFALQNKANQIPRHGGDAKAAARFQKIINRAGSAPVRIAFVMTPRVEKDLVKMQATPSPFAAVAGPLQSMDTATLTLKPGKAPALDLTMTFGDVKSAQAVQSAFNTEIMMVQSMAKGRLTQMPNGPSPKVIDALFKNLQPTRHGKQLAIVLRGRFVRNLGKLVPALAPILQAMHPRGPQQQTGGANHLGPPLAPQSP